MKLVVGLGNPGGKYEQTRHNVGYRVVDLMRSGRRVVANNRDAHYRGWEISLAGRRVILLRTLSFMNESGVGVKRALRAFGGEPDDLVVVHDDIDLPVGRVKLTKGRGPGTHNGVRSVAAEIDSRDFVRVRIGIGREGVEGPRIDYVLSEFLPDEREAVDRSVEEAAKAAADIVLLGLAKAMSLHNA